MVSDRRPNAERTTANRQGWTPLHETTPDHGATPHDRTAPQAGESASDAADGQVVETGTTIVTLQADDSVVVAADQRASLGGRFVTNKSVQKVEQIHPTAAVALSGAVGHIQQFVRTMRAETRLYSDRRGEDLSMDALATLAGNVLGSTPMQITPVLGGVGETGPRVFSIDGGGGVLSDDYAAGGSGMQLAYGVLERQYDDGLTAPEARTVAAEAIGSASERDTASGNGVTIATVTAEGVETDEYATTEEVA
ncbi:proteasome subunit beta [Halobacterium zhouii]|uniref:proteasome subunit beta n=1 Tax=Halobacterium zhouii TaxID=2902624 RepID=UPI001E4BCA88|nr:proteasome subunit beta [Halobacterium zhouii]